MIEMERKANIAENYKESEKGDIEQ